MYILSLHFKRRKALERLGKFSSRENSTLRYDDYLLKRFKDDSVVIKIRICNFRTIRGLKEVNTNKKIQEQLRRPLFARWRSKLHEMACFAVGELQISRSVTRKDYFTIYRNSLPFQVPPFCLFSWKS